jgi:glutamyl-Q tRNA(Asp) synthetase
MGSYLDARSGEGKWLVRMEDIDPPREKPGAADSILSTLDLFGFEWDGPVLYQSSRIEAYAEAADKLVADGLAFRCSCSRKEIQQAGLKGSEGTIYPGTCRSGYDSSRAVDTLRIVTDAADVCFSDLIHGRFIQNLQQDVGDFVIRRADGLYAYQLAVVVDDAFQGISHVVRGSDLLLSTPRQLFLQQLLGLPLPEYAHLPLVLGEDGTKLSKQSMAWPVGVDNPLDTLLKAAGFLGQVPSEETPSNMDEFWEWAISSWDRNRVPIQKQ